MEPTVKALVKKELLQLLRGRQLLLFFLAQVVLAVASFTLAARQWRGEVASAQMLLETNRQRLATLTDWSEVEATGMLVPPPLPAGRFLVSLRPWPAFLVTVPSLPMPVGVWREQPTASPVQVLLLFYSLFPLLLSFDSVAGEKAQRTLGFLLAVVGSRRLLLHVKFLVRGVVVMASTGVSLGLAALGSWLVVPEFVQDPSFFQVFPALVLFFALFSLVFVALGLAFSCLFPDSLTSLLAGVGGWVVFTILLPGLGQGLARTFFPPPSRSLFDAQAAALETHYSQKEEEARLEPMRRWLREGPALQQWYENEANRIRREMRAALQKELLELLAGFLRKEERAARAELWATGVLPVGLLHEGVTGVAAANDESFLRYVRSVTEYAGILAQEVEKRRGAIRYVMAFEEDPYAHSRPKLEEIPSFKFSLPEASWAAALPRLLGLLLWTGTFYFLALVALRRLDPR
ncbi:MAG: ABC transporter permease [Thermoanaerobaculaceae bacterium]